MFNYILKKALILNCSHLISVHYFTLLYHNLINKEEAAMVATQSLVADVARLGFSFPTKRTEGDAIVMNHLFIYMA